MKPVLLLAVLLPFLFLGGCNNDNPTRGLGKGTQIVYAVIQPDGREAIIGETEGVWLADKTKDTFTVRFKNGAETIAFKSRVEWIMKAKTQNPMPASSGVRY